MRRAKLVQLLRQIKKNFSKPAKQMKRGRGKAKTFSDLSIVLCAVVMVVHKTREFQALHDFLEENPKLQKECKLKGLPHRTTFSRRIKRVSEVVRIQIQHLGDLLIHQGAVSGKTAAVDKSLFRSVGPLWHKSYREKGIIPDKLRNVDVESAWGYSPYHGFVQGYGLHAVCTAEKGEPMVFVDAWVEPANVDETQVFPTHVLFLSDSISRVLADTKYSGQASIELVQRQQGGRITRRLVTPVEKTKSTSVSRAAYADYFASPWGRHFYRLRKITIEPLFGRIKTIFQMKERVWMKGLKNVRALILSAIYVYQVVMVLNLIQGESLDRIKPFLNAI